MTKKILVILLLLAAGFYAMTVQGEDVVDPTQTAQASQTPQNLTKLDICKVYTGVEAGTVNLRACPGAACGAVLDILTEGESLTILTAGEYVNVTNKGGVTGWLNNKYCKGK